MRKRSFNILVLLLLVEGLSGQSLDITTTAVTCNGYSDGTITAVVTGGTGDLTYNLSAFVFPVVIQKETIVSSDHTHVFSGYPAGTYIVTVTDESLNEVNDFAVIVSNPPIQIQSTSITDQSCSDQSDGSIEVIATGEDNNLIYTLTGPVNASNSTGSFTSLPSGTYDIEVSHATCSGSDNELNIVVDAPPPLTLTLDNTVSTTCFAGDDGSIEITPGGGTPSGVGSGYTYSWTGPNAFTSTDEDIFDLEPGDYSVNITDANGCIKSLGPITLGQATEIALQSIVDVDITCTGGSDGSATITVTGGTAPYSFSWDGQGTAYHSTDQNPNDFPADTYDLTITDDLSCEKVFNAAATIAEPDPISNIIESFTNVTCFGDSDGSADVTVSGGTLPYVYNWTGTGGYASGDEDPTGMPPDVYSLKVTDGNGCIQNFAGLVTITGPADITTVLDDFSDETCFALGDGSAQITVSNGTPGYSYLWTGNSTAYSGTDEDPTDLEKDTYDLQVTDANSCVKNYNDFVVIDGPSELTASVTIQDVNCFGASTGEIALTPFGGTSPYTFSWSGPDGYNSTDEDVTGLFAGIYNVTITDDNGCTTDYNSNSVDENSEILASFDITDITCNGSANGEIDATVSGGVAPFTFSWSADNGYSSTDQDITGLSAGNYTLTATDVHTCIKVFTAQTIAEPVALSASFNSVDASCFDSNDGSIDVTASNGTSPYGYTWTGPNGFNSTDQNISDLEPGDYSLVLNDANSCSINLVNIVTVNSPDEIAIIPSATNISCNAANDGAISIVVSGGVPSYTYLWNGPNGFSSSSKDIADLEPGSYNLTITDNNSCNLAFSPVATLTEPDGINVTVTDITNIPCSGAADGEIEIDVTGGTVPYSFSWKNNSGVEVSTTEDPSSLFSDTYSLEVSDNSSCIQTFTDLANISEPDALTASLNNTDVLCEGDANGTITINPSGGTAPYEHSFFNSGPYTLSNPITGLSEGSYRIYTRDANGCKTFNDIDIIEPEALIYDFSVGGLNKCNGDSSGIITISNVTGGTPPYEYSIDGGTSYFTSSSFTKLPAGDYPVIVKDMNSCTKSISPLSILEPNPINIFFYNQVDISTCYDSPEGEIAIQGSGGTGSLKYSLDGGAVQGLGEFLNIYGGIHTLSIIDESLCTRDTIVELDRPDIIIFNSSTVTNVSGCQGNNNGELDVSAIGGSGSIEYAIDGGSFQPSGNFTSLFAGDHIITAKDAAGCEKDTTISLTEPAAIVILSESAIPVSCNGTSTGSVSVDISGGTPPLTYTLDPPLLPPQNTNTFSGLPAGDYTIKIEESAGCNTVTTNIISITEPAVFVKDSLFSGNISCNGNGDGRIAIYVSGGSSPYEYSIDNELNYIADSAFFNLSPGGHETYAKDANGCKVYLGNITITEPQILTIASSTTDVSTCFGDSNGSISVSASGGWGLYMYSIDGMNYQASGDFSDLPADDYTIYSMDSANCLASVDVNIDQPEQLTAIVTKTNYADEVLGTITITNESGGTPPYLYGIEGLSGTFSSDTFYSGLIKGNYEVVVKDANECSYSEMLVIYDIVPLITLIDSNDVSCFGMDDGKIEFQPQDAVGAVQFSINNGSSYQNSPLFENLKGDSTYYLHAIDEDEKQFFDTIYIAEPDEITADTSIIKAKCNAFSETGSISLSIQGGVGNKTVTWSNGSMGASLTNISQGQYNYTIVDETGCELKAGIFLPSIVTIDAYAGKDTTLCAGSTLVLNAEPADIMFWEPADNLSNQNISNPVISGINESISYVYTVTESGSGYACFDIDTLNIEVLPVYGLDITENFTGIVGQTIQLETSTTGNFDSYEWIPAKGLDDNTIMNPLATLTDNITYYLLATNDYGCIESDSVLIKVVENLKVYNAFSPNGDNVNDFFDIDDAVLFPDIIVEVFTRWGSKVFSSVGYTDEQRWDGTYNGTNAPTGTYYYVIIPYKNATPISGNVTIIR